MAYLKKSEVKLLNGYAEHRRDQLEYMLKVVKPEHLKEKFQAELDELEKILEKFKSDMK